MPVHNTRRTSACAGCLLVALLFYGVTALGAAPPQLPETQSWTGRSVVLTPEGSFHRYYITQRNGRQAMVFVESRDSGVNWSEPTVLKYLPPEMAGGCAAVRTRDDEVQLFMTVGRRISDGNRPAIDRFIDLWHMRSTGGRTQWSEPKRVFEGYIGSISNALQLDSGRVLIPFGSWIPGSASGPPTGNQFVTVIYSDDDGETFTQSDARLVSPCYPNYNGANVGACEPAVVQLKDGRVWLVMRTQAGVLYLSLIHI